MDTTKICNGLEELNTLVCPEEMKVQNRTMCIDIICPVCGQVRSIWVNPEDIMDIKQRIFPDYLSADDREGFITGTCQKCLD